MAVEAIAAIWALARLAEIAQEQAPTVPPPTDTTIRARVVELNGAAVAGAYVEARKYGTTPYTHAGSTDATGVAAIAVPWTEPGSWDLRASYAGRLGFGNVYLAVAGGSYNATVTLTAEAPPPGQGELAVWVFERGIGAETTRLFPYTDQLVRAFEAGTSTVAANGYTDANGLVRILLPAGSYDVRVQVAANLVQFQRADLVTYLTLTFIFDAF